MAIRHSSELSDSEAFFSTFDPSFSTANGTSTGFPRKRCCLGGLSARPLCGDYGKGDVLLKRKSAKKQARRTQQEQNADPKDGTLPPKMENFEFKHDFCFHRRKRFQRQSRKNALPFDKTCRGVSRTTPDWSKRSAHTKGSRNNID